MSLLVSLLAAVVVFIAGWAVIKRYPTVIVLFAAGLIMIGLAILFGADSILPKNAKTTGLIWFDAIDIIRLAAIKQVAGIGMIIMVAGGFAKYMETIGASGALVHACISPLKALHSPYIVLGLCYVAFNDDVSHSFKFGSFKSWCSSSNFLFRYYRNGAGDRNCTIRR